MSGEWGIWQMDFADSTVMLFEQKSWRKSDGEMDDEIKLKKNVKIPMILLKR